MSEQASIKTFPSIQGRCPSCRGDSLFIGSGGYVTCSRLDCPNPSAADDLLHGEHRAQGALDRVREACDQLHRAAVLADDQPHSDRERGIVQAVTRVRAALDQPDPAAGPSVAEAAAQDAAHWNDKYAGEQP